jgi:hypothetical protein
MAVSSIDYEKIDHGLLQILQMIKSMEQMVVASQQQSQIPNTNIFISALDDYRNEVALEIERQGKR